LKETSSQTENELAGPWIPAVCESYGAGLTPDRSRLSGSRSHLPLHASGPALVAIDDPALHHEDDPAKRFGVGQGIAVDRDQVGVEAGYYGPDAILEAQGPGRERSRGNQGAHRLLPAVANAAQELLGVSSVGAGDGVGPEDDRQAGSRNRPAEHVGRLGEGPLHDGEALLVVVADPEVLRLVVEIVAEDQPALGIEVGPVRRELRERLGRCEDPVL